MITVQQEVFPPFLTECKPLFPKHWEELALDKDKIPLDPDYDEYLRRDKAGLVMPVTAREDGQLVGYSVNFVAPGLHYKTCLTLTTDIYWVLPDARGAKIGFALFGEVERLAKARGVQRIFAGVKEHFSAGWMFERMGYLKVETYYSKFIGEGLSSQPQ